MSTSEERVLLKRSLSTRERIRKAEVDVSFIIRRGKNLQSNAQDITAGNDFESLVIQT